MMTTVHCNKTLNPASLIEKKNLCSYFCAEQGILFAEQLYLLCGYNRRFAVMLGSFHLNTKLH